MDMTTIQACIDSAVRILKHNIAEFGSHFWGNSSVNNRYQEAPNDDWTEGFITGCYWLAWEETDCDLFRETATAQCRDFLRRMQERVKVDHHDMGFLYSLSCVAAWKLTGDEEAKSTALLAADNLMRRFQEKGQFFQAWGEFGAKDNYRLIIDCLLNLPLLFWASVVTGDPIYREKAEAHTRTSLQNLVRSDWSTYHTFFFDPVTGAPDRGVTAQGYRNDTAWARGQSWGVYGTALSYRLTRNPDCIPLFKGVADYFMSHLSSDGLPYWDLSFPDGADEPWDSSAAAIAACGMLEMAKYLPANDAAKYTAYAHRLAEALAEKCAVRDISVANGLLLHGVYGKSSPYNTVQDAGVDECTCWGDYFWFELLTRLKNPDWNLYW